MNKFSYLSNDELLKRVEVDGVDDPEIIQELATRLAKMEEPAAEADLKLAFENGHESGWDDGHTEGKIDADHEKAEALALEIKGIINSLMDNPSADRGEALDKIKEEVEKYL